MWAAYVDGLGSADVIRFGKLPDPVPGPGQVLIRVQAVAVDTVDTYVRSGRWRTPVSFPLVVGRDLVGTVAAVGAGVTDLQQGQPVWTNSAGYGGRAGATAELVPVERDRLYLLPAGADPAAFVAAVHPGATAYGVLRRAHLAAGETVAVVGANGAVGMCLVQVAAAYGAQVVAFVRNARAESRLRQLGTTRVVVADASAAPQAADGLDVFVDTSGHIEVTAIAERLAPRGRIVLIAGQGSADLDVWSFYTRELQLLGFVMSAMTTTELAAAAQWINERYRAQPLSIGVGAVRGFADAAWAHGVVEAGRQPKLPDGTTGRIVLRPAPSITAAEPGGAGPGPVVR